MSLGCNLPGWYDSWKTQTPEEARRKRRRDPEDGPPDPPDDDDEPEEPTDPESTPIVTGDDPDEVLPDHTDPPGGES